MVMGEIALFIITVIPSVGCVIYILGICHHAVHVANPLLGLPFFCQKRIMPVPLDGSYILHGSHGL